MIEDKLFNLTQQRQQSGPNSERDLLELANTELRKKERRLRDTVKKQEIFEGKNLENKSEQDLELARRQLTDALKVINNILDRKNK